VHDERTGAVLILDAGTGIVGALRTCPVPNADGAGRRPGVASAAPAARVLLTHYHWDHIQGLPFFTPLYESGWAAEIWGPRIEAAGPGSVDALFRKPFYPVSMRQLPSAPTMQTVDGPEVQIGDFHIATQALNHPGGALAYRIRGRTGDVVYATDHEFGTAEHDQPLARFVRGARAVILDSHFTPEELPGHRGWGHSSWDQCAQFASRSEVGQLWLFHHKPGRTDAEIERIEAAASRIFAPTRAAREGVTFEV
jgi:phosphoribosyl 1,2-cyclic phosphodiesterase